MRYFKPRRQRFRSNDRGFRRNNSFDLKIGDANNVLNNFQRKSYGRNGQKAEILLEKYNNLAKEASTSGDRILSESYYQHADHFLRVIENRNSIQNNVKPHLDNSSTKNSSDGKVILDNEKNFSSQKTQEDEEV